MDDQQTLPLKRRLEEDAGAPPEKRLPPTEIGPEEFDEAFDVLPFPDDGDVPADNHGVPVLEPFPSTEVSQSNIETAVFPSSESSQLKVEQSVDDPLQPVSEPIIAQNVSKSDFGLLGNQPSSPSSLSISAEFQSPSKFSQSVSIQKTFYQSVPSSTLSPQPPVEALPSSSTPRSSGKLFQTVCTSTGERLYFAKRQANASLSNSWRQTGDDPLLSRSIYHLMDELRSERAVAGNIDAANVDGEVTVLSVDMVS
jgi:hypothetical protein